MIRQLKVSTRALLSRPGVTIPALLIMAIALGASTAIFKVADGLMFKPVPGLDASRLVMILEKSPNPDSDWSMVTPADYLDWSGQSRSFEGMSAISAFEANLAGPDYPERIPAFSVTPDFLTTLGVQPLLGGGLAPGDSEGVLISYRLWQRLYGGRSEIIGEKTRINGAQYTLVGVMPNGFNVPQSADLWVPLIITPERMADRGAHNLEIIAKLKKGAEINQASGEMAVIGQRLAEEYPNTNKGWGVRVYPFRDFISGTLLRPFTILLMFSVSILLLVACANVAGLRVAAAIDRSREVAIRTALGANRGQIAKPLLVESLILSGASACLGLLIAKTGISAVVSNMPPRLADAIVGWGEIRMDLRAIAFIFAVALMVGVLTGLVTTINIRPSTLYAILKEGGRSGTGRRRILSTVLVIGEVAFSVVLMVTSILAVKSAYSLLSLKGLLKAGNVLTMRTALPEARYNSAASKVNFYKGLIAGVSTGSGVASAAIATDMPYDNSSTTIALEIEGGPAPNGEKDFAQLQCVSPLFFRTLGIPVIQGREFQDIDAADAQPVAVVSENFVRRYLRGGPAIGQRVRLIPRDSHNTLVSVVGVAGDVRYDWSDKDQQPVVYLSYQQFPESSVYLAIRTVGDPDAAIPLVRGTLNGLDRDQPVYDVQHLDQLMSDGIAPISYLAALIGVLAVTALVLSSAGVYSLVASAVSERTREIGIRMALGAMPRSVVATMLRRSLRVAWAGLGAGAVAAFFVARMMADVMEGLSGSAGLLVLLSVAILFLVILAASALPALKSARVDPVQTLRQE
jgi:predicted permease